MCRPDNDWKCFDFIHLIMVVHNLYMQDIKINVNYVLGFHDIVSKKRLLSIQ